MCSAHLTPGYGAPYTEVRESERDRIITELAGYKYAIITGDFDSRKLGSISFEFVRVPYNIKEEIEELEKSDMPFKDKAIEALTIAYVR